MNKKGFSYDLLEISNRCINRDVKEEIFEKNSEKAGKKAYCESEKYKLVYLLLIFCCIFRLSLATWFFL